MSLQGKSKNFNNKIKITDFEVHHCIIATDSVQTGQGHDRGVHVLFHRFRGCVPFPALPASKPYVIIRIYTYAIRVYTGQGRVSDPRDNLRNRE